MRFFEPADEPLDLPDEDPVDLPMFSQLECSTCNYSAPMIGDDGDPVLKCRRYPAALFVWDGHVTQAFPDAVDPCGEHSDVA